MNTIYFQAVVIQIKFYIHSNWQESTSEILHFHPTNQETVSSAQMQPNAHEQKVYSNKGREKVSRTDQPILPRSSMKGHS